MQRTGNSVATLRPDDDGLPETGRYEAPWRQHHRKHGADDVWVRGTGRKFGNLTMERVGDESSGKLGLFLGCDSGILAAANRVRELLRSREHAEGGRILGYETSVVLRAQAESGHWALDPEHKSGTWLWANGGCESCQFAEQRTG